MRFDTEEYDEGWLWWLTADNGVTMARSLNFYSTRSNAKQAAEMICRDARAERMEIAP